MEERVTLEQLMEAVNAIDQRFERLATELHSGFRALKDRMDRIEFAVYQIQSEIENFQGEMRGIHKVIDRLNVRLVLVEGRLGFLSDDEPA